MSSAFHLTTFLSVSFYFPFPALSFTTISENPVALDQFIDTNSLANGISVTLTFYFYQFFPRERSILLFLVFPFISRFLFSRFSFPVYFVCFVYFVYFISFHFTRTVFFHFIFFLVQGRCKRGVRGVHGP